jgi:hypothetical protein
LEETKMLKDFKKTIKCDWCKTKPSMYTINEGEERICDDCYHECVECDRCGLEMHGDDCIEGLCTYCYSDLYD